MVRLRQFTRIAAVFLTATALSAAEAPLTAPTASAVPSQDLFRVVHQIQLSVDEFGMASLRLEPREYVRAQFRDKTDGYTNVAIKLKGARGSFRSIDEKPAFTLNFDKFTKDQEFFGLDKIHLNNSVQDDTFLNEIISSQLFLAAGVPTARATHARVTLNERDLGFYVLKEGYDKRFLKRHFGDNDGNLYDGGFLNDIGDWLEKDSGDGPDNWSDLDALLAAANTADLDDRLSALEQVLDVDRFITFVAMEMLICHWDGYSHNRNNYRLYNDPTTGKFVFIPHGMDQVFQNVNYSLDPLTPSGRRGWRDRGVLVDRAFEIPEIRIRYVKRMGELLNTVFTEENIRRTIDAAEYQLRTQLGREEPRLLTYMTSQARYMRRQTADRVRDARLQYPSLVRMLNQEQREFR